MRSNISLYQEGARANEVSATRLGAPLAKGKMFIIPKVLHLINWRTFEKKNNIIVPKSYAKQHFSLSRRCPRERSERNTTKRTTYLSMPIRRFEPLGIRMVLRTVAKPLRAKPKGKMFIVPYILPSIKGRGRRGNRRFPYTGG